MTKECQRGLWRNKLFLSLSLTLRGSGCLGEINYLCVLFLAYPTLSLSLPLRTVDLHPPPFSYPLFPFYSQSNCTLYIKQGFLKIIFNDYRVAAEVNDHVRLFLWKKREFHFVRVSGCGDVRVGEREQGFEVTLKAIKGKKKTTHI